MSATVSHSSASRGLKPPPFIESLFSAAHFISMTSFHPPENPRRLVWLSVWEETEASKVQGLSRAGSEWAEQDLDLGLWDPKPRLSVLLTQEECQSQATRSFLPGKTISLENKTHVQPEWCLLCVLTPLSDHAAASRAGSGTGQLVNLPTLTKSDLYNRFQNFTLNFLKSPSNKPETSSFPCD